MFGKLPAFFYFYDANEILEGIRSSDCATGFSVIEVTNFAPRARIVDKDPFKQDSQETYLVFSYSKYSHSTIRLFLLWKLLRFC